MHRRSSLWKWMVTAVAFSVCVALSAALRTRLIGNRANRRQHLQQILVHIAYQGFDRLVALRARIALLFMLTLGAVLIGRQASEQHIDQVILQAIVLMGDEGDEMQIAVFVVAPGDLEDVYFNDTTWKVIDFAG